MALQWLTNLQWFTFALRAFTKQGYQRAAARFDNSALDPARNAGKLVIMTGANAGLGFAAASALASAGCSVLMLCRNRERGEAAAAAARAASGGGDVQLGVCDVSSLESIKAFSDHFLASEGRPLHALVNNAGALLLERGSTEGGLDLGFATNTLGGLALTARLLPALRRAPGARVVFVSSGGMYTAPLELEGWEDDGKPWDGTRAYALDKRRQVAQAEELARRWGPMGVTVVSMHPGWADTPGVRSSLPGFSESMGSRMRAPAEGADTMVWLSLEDAAKLEPGAFYLDRAPQVKHLRLSGTAYPSPRAAALVDGLLAMAGLQPGAEGGGGGGGD
ncbi:MAG: dehydrogenase/reductase SDR family member 12-like protein [Monoraphidium minutum]|nr:MAG: dehydrogenase/reductase SDR family member 12-like protein [Monoraphidium minutum]